MHPEGGFLRGVAGRFVARDSAVLGVAQSQLVPQVHHLELSVDPPHGGQHPRGAPHGRVETGHPSRQGPRAPREEVPDGPALFVRSGEDAGLPVEREPLGERNVRHHPSLAEGEGQKGNDAVDPAREGLQVGTDALQVPQAEGAQDFGGEVLLDPVDVLLRDPVVDAGLVFLAEPKDLVLPPIGRQDPNALGAIDLVAAGTHGGSTVAKNTVSTGHGASIAKGSVVPGL
mmetsp:Transcript_10628/g.22411  ORF Transcript_10628/g.22411 Transcript_10628/m.22411 type:complete len:229 (-) Transcript_10628:190-876(-)